MTREDWRAAWNAAMSTGAIVALVYCVLVFLRYAIGI